MGRSTQDLLDTLNQLAGWNVSVVAMSELDSPHGRMMATMLAGIAQFERDLMRERINPASPPPRHVAKSWASNPANAQGQTALPPR